MTASSSPPLPATMKAVQVTAFNQPYQINTVPVPSILDPYDLLVKVAVASYCHTDSMVATGAFNTPLPVTASHEGAGTVVAVGSSASSLFHPGDRVMCGIPLNPCATCTDCVSKNNHQQYCPNTHGHIGVHTHGCLAEYVRTDARTTTPLPPTISLRAAAPLACAGRTAWRGVARTNLTEGQWLLIIGAGGGLGHLAMQFAKNAHKLRVMAVDARDAALELAWECGADVMLDAREEGDGASRFSKGRVLEQVRMVTGGVGADAALVLSDAVGATGLAARATRMHGVVVQVAQPGEVSVPFEELVFRDIRLRGSLLCSPEESREMVGFIEGRGGATGRCEKDGESEGGLRVENVLFEGLESIGEVLELVGSGKLAGKAVVVVDPRQLEEERKLQKSK